MAKPKIDDIERVMILNNQAAILMALSIVMKTMAGNIEMSIKLGELFDIVTKHIESRHALFETYNAQSTER